MASTLGADRLQFCRDVVVNQLDDGSLVINLETGKTWKLNRVGAAVCRSIEQGGDLSHTATEVADQYGVDVATVRRDIEALLIDLRREGLVESQVGG